MNILFITTTDPRSASFGASQRTHLLWKALRERGTVYTVVLAVRGERMRVDEANRIRTVSMFSSNIFVLLLQVLLARKGGGIAWPFRSRRFIRSLIGWDDVEFDFAVVRYVRSAAMTAAWKIAPCYLDVDDWPPEAFRTRSVGRYGAVSGALLHGLISCWSKFVLRRCAGAWVANADQAGVAVTRGRTMALCNLPIEPCADYNRSAGSRTALLTVGGMFYDPNWRGVDRFLNEVWPTVHSRFPHLEYWIAGGGAPQEAVERWKAVPNVKALGFVDDLDRLYERTLATVVPIWSGAGTCIKTRESLQRGRVCLSSPFGARGCDPSWMNGGNGLHVFESAEGFAAALKRFVLDDEERVRQEDAAIKLAEREFSFEAFSKSVWALVMGAPTECASPQPAEIDKGTPG